MSKTSAPSPTQFVANVQLATRVKKLKIRLADQGVDALLVTNPRDIRYLTGFVGDDSWALVTLKGTKVYVISDRRFEEQIQREAPQVKAVMREKSLAEALAGVQKKTKLTRIGLQPDYVTVTQQKVLAKNLGRRLFKPIEDGLLKQRSVKDQTEVNFIRNSLKIQQAAFKKLISEIRPGDTEQALAARLEYLMRSGGADGTSFPSIIAADANASLPHAIPGSAKVAKGGIVLIDWGSKLGGYCSDLTRVISLGKMPAKIQEIYKVCLEAQVAAIEAIGPGKSLKDIDKVARDIIDKAGFGKEFGHSLGHGLGLDIHEQPVLSTRSEGVLEPGQVVTVEPGIYLPGIGGVRIEDDILVTPAGHEVLSDLPKDLSSAMI